MIYVLSPDVSEARHVKIGKAKVPAQRLRELQTGNPEKLKIWVQVDWPDDYEGRLHRLFAAKRVVGEWFALDAEINDFIALLTSDQNAAKALIDEKTRGWVVRQSVMAKGGVERDAQRRDREKYRAYMKDYMRQRRGSALVSDRTPNRRSREDYNAYMREYMRKRRGSDPVSA